MGWTGLSWPCQGKALGEPPGWAPPVDVFQRPQISMLWPSSFVAQRSAPKAASTHAPQVLSSQYTQLYVTSTLRRTPCLASCSAVTVLK